MEVGSTKWWSRWFQEMESLGSRKQVSRSRLLSLLPASSHRADTFALSFRHRSPFLWSIGSASLFGPEHAQQPSHQHHLLSLSSSSSIRSHSANLPFLLPRKRLDSSYLSSSNSHLQSSRTSRSTDVSHSKDTTPLATTLQTWRTTVRRRERQRTAEAQVVERESTRSFPQEDRERSCVERDAELRVGRVRRDGASGGK